VWGTDPKNPDTDWDGLLDSEEVFIYGTDPLAFGRRCFGRKRLSPPASGSAGFPHSGSWSTIRNPLARVSDGCS
jgi:hypothetical protein